MRERARAKTLEDDESKRVTDNSNPVVRRKVRERERKRAREDDERVRYRSQLKIVIRSEKEREWTTRERKKVSGREQKSQ